MDWIVCEGVVWFTRVPIGVCGWVAVGPNPSAFHQLIVVASPQVACDSAKKRKLSNQEIVLRQIVDGHQVTTKGDGFCFRISPIGLVEQVVGVTVGRVGHRMDDAWGGLRLEVGAKDHGESEGKQETMHGE